MQENLRMIGEMLRHDAAAVLGFLLLGIGGFISIRLELKLMKAGYRTSDSFFAIPLSGNRFDAPLRYLKVRAKHGWSAWPAYLIWLCLVAGIALLVFGLFHLAD